MTRLCELLILSVLCLVPLHLSHAAETDEANNATTPAQTEEATEATSAVENKAAPTVAFIHISETIDEWQAQYIKRVIDDAVTRKVDYIVTHIDSFGGRVDSALLILDSFLNLTGPDQPRTIAFIDAKAISAAALIAYGHHEVYMTPPSLIGDIGVIFVNAEGEMAYAPEKSVTLIRSKLNNASAIRGWDSAWLQKMTDRNQKLFQIRHPDGRIKYIIEENLPLYLADNEDIEKDNEKQIIQMLGEDRFVTKHAKEAVEYNIATGVVADLDEVFANIGAKQNASINLSPTDTENISRYLSTWAPLLLSLTIILVVFEMKSPGVGLFAGLACVTGTLYFICQYYQNLANAFEIVLIIIGLLLIATEIFTMVGGGALALVGAIIAFVGIFLSFMPDSSQFDFDNPFYSDYLNSAIMSSVLTSFVIIVAFVLLLFAAPRIPAMQRFAMKGEISGTSEAEDNRDVIGGIAKALTQLRPSGQIQLESGLAHSAQAEHGTFIDAGSTVRILDQQYGDFIVTAVEADTHAADISTDDSTSENTSETEEKES